MKMRVGPFTILGAVLGALLGGVLVCCDRVASSSAAAAVDECAAKYDAKTGLTTHRWGCGTGPPMNQAEYTLFKDGSRCWPSHDGSALECMGPPGKDCHADRNGFTTCAAAPHMHEWPDGTWTSKGVFPSPDAPGGAAICDDLFSRGL